MATKLAILDFWRRSIPGLRLWRPVSTAAPQPTTLAEVEERVAQSEWAELAATRGELYLSLCWGDPKECQCDWARPASGCEKIIATLGEPSGIKV